MAIRRSSASRPFETQPGVEIHAKLEFHNAGGSVKDRAALAMVEDGQRRGLLGAGQVLLDATSGNTGISYAMLGAARGFLVKLCVPANVTRERRQMLQSYGAEVVLTDPMDGSDGAIEEARRIYAGDPARYFYPDQVQQRRQLARALRDDRRGDPRTDRRAADPFRRRPRHQRHVHRHRPPPARLGRPIELVAVQPESPLHALEGLKHMASALVPRIFDPSLADRNLTVTTEEAHAMTRRLVRDAGLFVGPSSGAALAASPRGRPRHRSRRASSRSSPTAAGATCPSRSGRRPGRRCGCPWRRGRRSARTAWPPIPTSAAASCSARRTARSATPGASTTRTDLERRRRFLIGPDDYRRAEARAAERGLDIVGFYHSHPDHPAEPSAFDLAHAWPNLSYAIVSIRGGVPREMRSWRLRADRSGYDEESIT